MRSVTAVLRDLNVQWLTGGLLAVGCAAASLLAAPGLQGVTGAALAALMLAIAATDARHFRVPDRLNAAALVLGLAHAAIAPHEPVHELAMAALRGLLLGLAFWMLREVYWRLRGRDGLGLGDVKLAGVAGVWVDGTMIPVAIELAALTALAAYGLRRWRRGRPLRAEGRLPFGLFLGPAVWLTWLLQALLA